MARHAARLSQQAAQSQPTAAEAAACKRELFAEAQAQLAAQAARRERETLERRGGGATLSLGVSQVGLVTAEQAQARVEAERATLAANLRMAAQRAEAQRAARDAQRAAERENGGEWLDPRRRPRV